MSTLVMKFGGTSVGSVKALSQAADVIEGEVGSWDRLVVVVSAMSGVTDRLIRGALTAAHGDADTFAEIAEDLSSLHHATIDGVLLDYPARAEVHDAVDALLGEYTSFCASVNVLGEITPRALDAISSLGERMNARTMSALLRSRGLRSCSVDATELIVTDATFQNALPLMGLTEERARERLAPLLEQGLIPVVTGFIGATEEGVTTTLGRGGSDYSAAILGACLDGDEVWTWTDVDGVMSADPRLVPSARVIPMLSYAEVSELAYFGAKVLHPRTIRPVVERNIPLWVKNTFNPSYPGTKIMGEPEGASGTVKAVTAIRGMSLITVEGRGMMGVPGIAARTFAAVASRGSSVLMISQASSEQSICFVIPTSSTDDVVEALEDALSLELARRDIERVWSFSDVDIVTAVGAGMRHTPGVAAQIFGSLADASINVIAIAQGSSECSISIVVSSDDTAAAVEQIHREVIING